MDIKGCEIPEGFFAEIECYNDVVATKDNCMPSLYVGHKRRTKTIAMSEDKLIK